MRPRDGRDAALARAARITLPLLWPNMIVVIVLALIRGVQTFDEVFVLTGGGPGTATLMVVQYIYETGSPTGAEFRPRRRRFRRARRRAVRADAAATRLSPAQRRAEMQPCLPAALRRVARPAAAWHWTDIAAYAYLALGVVLMFGPVLWLVPVVVQDRRRLCWSFRRRCCHRAAEVTVPGPVDKPLPLFRVTLPDGRAGTGAGSPHRPHRPDGGPGRSQAIIRVAIDKRKPVRASRFATRELHRAAAAVRLSALSRQFGVRHRRRDADHAADQLDGRLCAVDLRVPRPQRGDAGVIGTLMIPITIILVPVYLVVTELGLVNSLWAVILPGAATPTGVFLLRQYMLTLPDDLIEAARMDKASEWQIYWRIVMPLTRRRWRCWRSSRSCGAGTSSCGRSRC